MYVDDESFIDMATSISGSGPAYIFMLMESMIDAGVHMGFPREKATTLVYHTMLGSTLYAMESKEHPAILRNMVTSPSGTTASALYELENGRFRTVIKDAMWACYRRSLEMGNHDSNVGPGRAHFPGIVRTSTSSASSGVDLAERIHENHNKNRIKNQLDPTSTSTDKSK
jgi:Pyrroline-5-carboxylate reductase dimerisation